MTRDLVHCLAYSVAIPPPCIAPSWQRNTLAEIFMGSHRQQLPNEVSSVDKEESTGWMEKRQTSPLFPSWPFKTINVNISQGKQAQDRALGTGWSFSRSMEVFSGLVSPNQDNQPAPYDYQQTAEVAPKRGLLLRPNCSRLGQAPVC